LKVCGCRENELRTCVLDPSVSGLPFHLVPSP
jgi:hypothetical protein